MRNERNLANEVIDLQKKFLWPCVTEYMKVEDRVFVEGKGVIVKDSEGREYIDCFAGIGTVNVGHCHPKVVAAVQAQAERLTHLSTLYYTEPMPRLAEKLSDIAPMEKGKVKKSFFCTSGTEANEHAITLAKTHTGARGVIGLQCAYHGRGGVTMSVSGLANWSAGLGPFAPAVYHAPAYYCYRCPMLHKEGPPGCDYACARYVEYMLRTEVSERVAAFIAEPVLGVSGVISAPPDYFKIVKDSLDSKGVLFIADEVQTGAGRTGKMFGIEHYDVEPDIVTMAKGLGGGFPIGAVTAKSKIADSYQTLNFSTFGGDPVSCVAALATIDVIVNEHLLENANVVGDLILKRLKEMASQHKILDDVQGKGLNIGAEIVSDKQSRKPGEDQLLKRILKEMLERHFLIGRGGPYYNRIRIQPPLQITTEQAQKLLDAFDETLKSVTK